MRKVNSDSLRKVSIFISIYGFRRTFYKIIGRSKSINVFIPSCRKHDRRIVIIGCGQYSIGTLQYVIDKNCLRSKGFVFDVDNSKSERFAKLFGYSVLRSINEVPDAISGDLAYVLSNHSSHLDYSKQLLVKGYRVFSEKPAVVSFDQLKDLRKILDDYPESYYLGYNRPHSRFVKEIISCLGAKDKFSLNINVAAHVLSKDHWYRLPSEGTRVCGNIGHWLDLFIYLIHIRSKVFASLEITLAYSDLVEADDNLSISITTDYGDLFNFCISSRVEVVDGINEVLVYSNKNGIAVIDDFRTLTIKTTNNVNRKTLRNKDVGHEDSLLRPYKNHIGRAREEITASASLMLHIKDMVQSVSTNKKFVYETDSSTFKEWYN